MVSSGTTTDVIEGLNLCKKAGIPFRGGRLRQGFDLAGQELPGRFDFVRIHPPYRNISRHSEPTGDPGHVEDYGEFRRLLMTCLKRCCNALPPDGRMWSLISKVQQDWTSDRKHYGRLEDVPIRHEHCVVFRKTEAVVRAGATPAGPVEMVGAQGKRA